MAFRRCCCGRECTYFTDGFNRVDSDSLGDDWTEVVGDWDISGSELVNNSPSFGDLAIANKEHPILSVTGHWWVTAKNVIEDAIYGLVFNYQNQSNFNVLLFGTNGTHSYMQLAFKVAGSWTFFGWVKFDSHDATGEDVILNVCRSDVAIWFRTDIGAGFHESYVCLDGNPPETPAGGYQGGVMNFGKFGAGTGTGTDYGNAEALHFDDFKEDEHRLTLDICPTCGCDCEGECVPFALLATVIVEASPDYTGTGSGDDICDIWNGITTILESEGGPSPDGWTWYGEFTEPTGTGIYECGPMPVEITLTCLGSSDTDVTQNWELCAHNPGDTAICGMDNSEGTSTCPALSFWSNPHEDSTCYPLYLLFGPFDCVPGGAFQPPYRYWIAITRQAGGYAP